MMSMHGPTLPGGRGHGGRRRKVPPKEGPKFGRVKLLDGPPPSAVLAAAPVGTGTLPRSQAGAAQSSSSASASATAPASAGEGDPPDKGVGSTAGLGAAAATSTQASSTSQAGADDPPKVVRWPIGHGAKTKDGEKVIDDGGAKVTEANYWERRTRRMREQGLPAETSVLRGCHIYFNGGTGKHSKLDLEALVQRNGGLVGLGASSRITHIVGTNTTATKTDQYLRRSKMSYHYVTPQWLLDSVAAGTRMPEHRYGMLRITSQRSMTSFVVARDSAPASGSAGKKRARESDTCADDAVGAGGGIGAGAGAGSGVGASASGGRGGTSRLTSRRTTGPDPVGRKPHPPRKLSAYAQRKRRRLRERAAAAAARVRAK